MTKFTPEELKIYKKLTSPAKVQDFLEKIPTNSGPTCYSPRQMLRYRKADCLEGALFAAAALQFHGHRPLVVDLLAARHDCDHVIALFKIKGWWGAISKSNHAVLRYREPVYRDIRELVMSYFHEYTTNDGRKTLRSFSRAVDLSRFNPRGWVTSDKDVWYIDRYLNQVPHYSILNKTAVKKLRRADPVEIKAGKIMQWKKLQG